jgi:GntR family transcriptional regulator
MLAKSQVTLEATVADRNEATLLKIKVNAPLFLMRGTVGSSKGRVIEYSKVLYRGDRLRFVAESN